MRSSEMNQPTMWQKGKSAHQELSPDMSCAPLKSHSLPDMTDARPLKVHQYVDACVHVCVLSPERPHPYTYILIEGARG